MQPRLEKWHPLTTTRYLNTAPHICQILLLLLLPCSYTLKWTLINNIGHYKATHVVRAFIQTHNMHLDPEAAHAPAVLDSSLLVTISSVVKHHLRSKHIDGKTCSMNSPLAHEVWVRFPTERVHPFRRLIAIYRKSLYLVNQAGTYWYRLQH